MLSWSIWLILLFIPHRKPFYGSTAERERGRGAATKSSGFSKSLSFHLIPPHAHCVHAQRTQHCIEMFSQPDPDIKDALIVKPRILTTFLVLCENRPVNRIWDAGWRKTLKLCKFTIKCKRLCIHEIPHKFCRNIFQYLSALNTSYILFETQNIIQN